VTLLPAQDRPTVSPAPLPPPSAPLLPPRPPWTEPGALPSSGPDGPVYTGLVADWRAAGRTVPGEPDREWDQLVRSPSGRAGR
jgi:hypothetical protein